MYWIAIKISITVLILYNPNVIMTAYHCSQLNCRYALDAASLHVGTETGRGPPRGIGPDLALLGGTTGPAHGLHDDTDTTEKRSSLPPDPPRNPRRRLMGVRRYDRPTNFVQNLESNHSEHRAPAHLISPLFVSIIQPIKMLYLLVSVASLYNCVIATCQTIVWYTRTKCSEVS